MRALTDEERETFSWMVENPDALALVNTELDGRDVAVIICVQEIAEDELEMVPLAILVNDDLMPRLADPMEETNE